MNVNIMLNLPCSEYRNVICTLKKRPVLTAENLQLFSSGRSNYELTNGRNISMFRIPKLIKACIYICIRIIKNANLTFVDIYFPNLRCTTREYMYVSYRIFISLINMLPPSIQIRDARDEVCSKITSLRHLKQNIKVNVYQLNTSAFKTIT